MPTSPLHRVFILTGIMSLLVSYVGLWIRFINDPIERTGSDFIAFYSAGRVAQEQGYARVYDPLLQQAVQEEQVGFPLVKGQVLLYNHLPFLVPILGILVNADYVNSFYRWALLLVALYIASLIVLSKSLRDLDMDQPTVWLTGLGAFLFLPLFFSLMNGQDTAILFLGVALWKYGLISKRETLSGLGLSLTLVRPHISLVLALPMLFSYRKVFMGYLIGSGFLAALSFLIVGVEGVQQYINILLISAGGEWHGMKEEAMFNLIGLLTRTMPALGAETIRLLGWIVYGVMILGLTFLWAKRKDLTANPIGPTVILALFTVPHLHFHDLTLLLIPIYELVRSGNLKRSTAIVLPIAVSLLLLISNVSVFLQYTTPYLVMLALICYPYYARQQTNLTSQHRS
jgi:hypothetical protein